MDMSALMPKPASGETGFLSTGSLKKKPCCPKKQKSGPWIEGTLASTYRNEYVDKEVPIQRGSARPTDYPREAGKFDPTTTYGGDFKVYEVERTGAYKPVNSQGLESIPFAAESAYKANFGPKAVPYQRAKAPSGNDQGNKGEFCGATTYGGDFVPRGVPQPARAVTRGNNIEPSGPFEGASLYKSTFTKMPFAKRDPASPASGGQVMPTGAFDEGTMYRSSFVTKEIVAPTQFKPADAGTMGEAEWYGGKPSSEYRGQFMDKEIPVNPPSRPLLGGEVMPKGPLDPTTTYGGDYKQYATGRQPAVRPANSMQQERVPFEGVSTYQGQYIAKQVPYSRANGGSKAYQPSKEVFDGRTTHAAAYQSHKVVPTTRGGPPAGSLNREHIPFEGKSAYASDYTKMPAGLRAETKGRSNEVTQTGPFDGATTYRVDFVEKEIPTREPDCVECDSCDEEI